MMDFIELPPSEGKKYCLVIVCMFSKCVDVFLTSKQDAGMVLKILLVHIIPCWGISRLTSSGYGAEYELWRAAVQQHLMLPGSSPLSVLFYLVLRLYLLCLCKQACKVQPN